MSLKTNMCKFLYEYACHVRLQILFFSPTLFSFLNESEIFGDLFEEVFFPLILLL